MSIALGWATTAHAQERGHVRFNSSFLSDVDASVVDRFATGNPVDAGIHLLDVVVNNQALDRSPIRFDARESSFIAVPCITPELLRMAGVKPERLLAWQEQACVDITALAPGAAVTYDSSRLALLLSLPQSVLLKQPAGTVAREVLDHGITGGFINYTLNARKAGPRRDTYVGLSTGVNWGAWRLRHRGSWVANEQASSYQRVSTALERPLLDWNSRLVLGESNTTGQIFPSTSFTGIQLASDERMLPDALRGYAPVVRGTAGTDARVQVLQKGYVIYEMEVAPGPFEITDLSPASYGGELEVVIEQADGSQQRFTVAMVVAPLALREGASRYELIAGHMRTLHGQAGQAPWFTQGGYARGLNNDITVIGGLQLSDGYAAAMAGGALSTRFGAVGLDATFSRAHDGASALSGSSLHASYQHHLQALGTNVGLAAYRYNTEGFRTLEDAANLRHPTQWPATARPRHRLELDFSQQLGQRHIVFVRSGVQSYWSRARPQTDYQAGIQGAFKRASYSLTATRTRLSEGGTNDSIQVALQVPLGHSHAAPQLSASAAGSDQGTQRQASLSGLVGHERAYSYQASLSDGAQGRSTSAYGQYRGTWANMGLGLANGVGPSRLSASVDGAIVIHPAGVNFAPPVGETFGLIKAIGASGGRVQGSATRIASNGVGVVSHMTPYRWNNLSLDPYGISSDVQLLQTGGRLAPTAGAMVQMTLPTDTQALVFIEATHPNGQPLAPFGADVLDLQGRSIGTLGQGGIIQLRGALSGRLKVHAGAGQRCELAYQAPSAPGPSGMRWTQAVCTALTTSEPDHSSPAHRGGLPSKPSLERLGP